MCSLDLFDYYRKYLIKEADVAKYGTKSNKVACKYALVQSLLSRCGLA